MKPTKTRSTNPKNSKKKLVREVYRDESYEYYPLGKHVVAAPGVCGGRPTFKYTRLEVSIILSLIAAGETVEQVVRAYSRSRLTPEAVSEAIRLADKALVRFAKVLQPVS